MQHGALGRLSLDDLWGLHIEVSKILGKKLKDKRQLVDHRIRRLNRKLNDLAPRRQIQSARRPYPPVLPKYRNPDRPLETWAGRGKQPRWLTEQLRAGRRLEDFRIC